jgi:hypothetical protein
VKFNFDGVESIEDADEALVAVARQWCKSRHLNIDVVLSPLNALAILVRAVSRTDCRKIHVLVVQFVDL